MTEAPRWIGAGLTDQGRVRASNQDSYWISNEHGLWIVADGMGGHAGGDVASRIAVERLAALIQHRETGSDPATWMQNALRDTNHTVHRESRQQRHLAGMGTTIVAVLKDVDSRHAVVGHVGDSRAYRYRDGGLTALTRDHTVVEEAIRAGHLSPEDARRHPHRHILSRAVGPDADVPSDIARHPCTAGDWLLLCSDGLTKMLDDDEIAGVLYGADRHAERACRALVDAANARGGDDNVTVIVVSVD